MVVEEEEEDGEEVEMGFEGREGGGAKFCVRNCWTDWLAKEGMRGLA